MDVFSELDGLKKIDVGLFKYFFVCGDPDEERLRVEYYLDRPNRSLLAKVRFGKLAQGPPNHAHGGAIAAVFDEVMGFTAFMNDYPAMTAKITIEYFEPVPLGRDILVRSRVESVEEKKVWVRAEMLDPEAQVLTSGEALLIVQTLERLEGLGRLNPEILEMIRSMKESRERRADATTTKEQAGGTDKG